MIPANPSAMAEIACNDPQIHRAQCEHNYQHNNPRLTVNTIKRISQINNHAFTY